VEPAQVVVTCINSFQKVRKPQWLRRDRRTLSWVYLQALRELAHHFGHADILRERVLAG
jgi:uncharacterized protein DUF664